MSGPVGEGVAGAGVEIDIWIGKEHKAVVWLCSDQKSVSKAPYKTSAHSARSAGGGRHK